ncbi:MAG: FGGY-family carbohydrate kinase [Planctomycetia bacterium]|nr:FGGY-family carbohydrate kinase [Planctomycetia bacterium]
MKYFLGIDNGGTLTKAGLFDQKGRELAVATCPAELRHPQKGFEEIDRKTLWDANARAIRSVLEKASVPPEQIACVAVAGHGNGMYLVDENGELLVGIHSTDTRAQAYVDRWNADGTWESLLPKTTQATWAAQPNALFRWFQDHDPETLRKARWLFMVKDYIRYCLTGRAAMERTDASATSLLNNNTCQYDSELLDAWGISECRRLLPPLVGTFDLCGYVTADAARKTGLAEGTPVAGGMFDIDAAGLAAGMTDATSLCLISGTWGNNQYIAPEPVVSKEVFMTTCYSIPGFYLMLEGSATSAANLEWFLREFLRADRELLQLRGGAETIYDRVNAEMAATTPKDCETVFLPYLYTSPVHRDAKGALLGLDAWQCRGHILRAICEGIVFGHCWHIDRLLQFRNMPDKILLAGGASKSPLWSQMFADILRVPVEIPDGSELGTLGAAIAGAVAVGEYPDASAACAAMVRFSRTFLPNPDWADVYQKKHDRFRELLWKLYER